MLEIQIMPKFECKAVQNSALDQANSKSEIQNRHLKSLDRFGFKQIFYFY